jgi:hypothetical protein
MNQGLFDKLLQYKSELTAALQAEKNYRKIFEKDFADEIEYLNSNNHKNEEDILGAFVPAPPGPFQYDMKKNHHVFKEIYKKLVKKIHPDLCQDEEEKKVREEKMKKATEFMKSENWEDLILLAKKEKVDIPYIPVEYNKLMKKKIEHVKSEIDFVKNKVCWVWCVDFKPGGYPKTQIYPSMNIVEEEYLAWKR